MMSFRGQASFTKMTSLEEKLTAQTCHPNENVNKAVQITYFFINIGMTLIQGYLSEGDGPVQLTSLN